MAKNTWDHILSVRQASPLVHNVTNFVVMNNTANALLAIGASPIMAHAPAEIAEMVALCQALVINIGTLDEPFIEAMLLAAKKAKELNKPWVLDPVGVGASLYRKKTVSELLEHKPTVIRGNASEILSLIKTDGTPSKGVDSLAKSETAINAAKMLHEQYGSIVCISGETDIIVGNGRSSFVSNGNPLMEKVTGLGCSCTAIIGAFIATVEDKFEAVTAAMTLMGVCGELAASHSNGPGSLQVNLLDKLYNITEETFKATLKISEDV